MLGISLAGRGGGGGTPIYGPIVTGTCCCCVSVIFLQVNFVVTLNLIVLEKLIK